MMSFEKGVDNSILSRYDKIYAKLEPIVTDTLELYSNEILFRLDSKNTHIKVLDELREKKETFSLFMRMSKRAFLEVEKTWLSVNLNMEVDDILDSNFIEYLTLLTQIHDIDNSKINFELVETEDIPNELKDIIISKIKQLSDMWFLFVIDDLYSWYSNKERIDILLSLWVKISIVKVDWKFLKEMFISSKWWFSMPNIVKRDWEKYFKYSIDDFDDFRKYITTLRDKWIKVVAEWIENEEIFDFAKELWFDYYQWYYIQNINSNVREI